MHHHITADSGYGSISLAHSLDNLGFYCTLNCRKNTAPTKLWDNLQQDLPKWHSRFAKKERLVVGVYHRKKYLNMVTNFFSLKESLKVPGGKERKKVLKNYDDTKRAADQFNRLWTNFHCDHGHKKLDQAILIGWLEWGL